jgi:hypothetical protein
VGDDYSVGYGKPPRQHQFKQGNQAARKRKGRTKTFPIPDLLGQALRTKRKIKWGGVIKSASVAEIFVERLIQMITNGSPRDLAVIVQLLERYLPDALAGKPEVLEIIHHRAEGSNVALPPDALWDQE